MMREKLIHLKNAILDRVRGVPDVVLIGENHVDLRQAHIIAEMIRKYRPEHVLLEAFDDKPPEELENLVNFYRVRTLEDVCRHHGVSLEDLGLGEDVLREIKEELDRELRRIADLYRRKGRKGEKEALELARRDLFEEGHVPRDYEELKKTPLYLLHPKVIDILCGKVSEKQLERVERSGKIDDVLKRMERVRKHVEAYRRDSSIEGIRRRRHDIILSAVADVGAKLAGCDLDKSALVEEIRRIDDRFLDRMARYGRSLGEDAVKGAVTVFRSLVERTTEIARAVGSHNPERERAMYERIKEYLNKHPSNTPVIAVVGRTHTESIARMLRKEGVKHRVVNLPTFTKNPVLGLLYRV